MNAVAGTFVKVESVATRKVVRLHIECPIEHANQVLETLGGFPDPANPVWVGIAPLRTEPVEQPKWIPDRTNPTTQCVLTCKKPLFWNYLTESRQIRCENEEDAAGYVRQFCRINTRADLAEKPEARQRWNLLLSGFEAWLEAA